jgi:Ca-activated chloride channel family protein
MNKKRMTTIDPQKQQLRKWLLIVALLFLGIASLRPQWGLISNKQTTFGLDMVIALDTSASMDTDDVQPSRRDRAAQIVHSIMGSLSGDRVGLVTFAGSASAICPLTLDYGAVDIFLQGLRYYRERVGGTNIPAAYREALTLFNLKAPYDKVLVIITDGENHEGSLSVLRQDAEAKRILIVPITIGSTTGQPIPEYDDQGNRIGYKKDRKGTIVISHADPKALQSIASIGPYDDTITGQKIIRDLQNLKRSKVHDRRTTLYTDRYHIFLIIGLGCLFAAYFLSTYRNPLLLIVLLFSFGSANVFDAHTLRAANTAVRAGRYDLAKSLYSRLPQTAGVRFNYLQLPDTNPEGFLNDLKIDNKRKAKLCLNLGNAAVKQGDVETAKNYFRQGLLFDHHNKRLKNNLELANIMKAQKNKNQQKQDKNKDNKNSKSAERVLNAFKQQEIQAMQQLYRSKEEKNVEKDW